MRTAVAVGALLTLATTPALAGPEAVLYSFKGGTDGAGPHGELVADAAGNLYGTTTAGGGSTACNGGCGTVFRLHPNGDGTYTEAVLHAFLGGADGASPQSGLVIDANGTLYGTTFYGGSGTCPGGCGTAFSVASDGTEVVLHAFQGALDGALPNCTLVLAPDGALYGVTVAGGSNHVVGGRNNLTVQGGGTFFRLSESGGAWTNTVLHRFNDQQKVQQPAQIMLGDDGVFYGTSVFNHTPMFPHIVEAGVFSVRPPPGGIGTWRVTDLFAGFGIIGVNLFGRPIRDSRGAIYGTAADGFVGSGAPDSGSVYKLTPSHGGGNGPVPWTPALLHGFQIPPDNTGDPVGGLLADESFKHLFGTTSFGGPNHASRGTVFELIRQQGGYRYKQLWAFRGQRSGGDGDQPAATLIADAAGSLYGTTVAGGAHDQGTVFRLTP